MTIKISSTVVILLAFLVSCEKDENGIYYNDEALLLSQVFYDSELYYEYTYNEANMVLEEKSKFHYARHHYNSRNVLSSSDYYFDKNLLSSSSNIADSAFNRNEWVNPGNTVKSGCRTYIYNDQDRLVKTSMNSGYTEYCYDTTGKISREILYHEQKKSGFIDYEYDDKGNLIKRSHYFILESGESELETTTEYRFDNHPNPYRAFCSLMKPGINTNINNITKEIYSLHFEVDQTIEKVQITENSYEYNELGYPVRKNGNFEYIYLEPI